MLPLRALTFSAALLALPGCDMLRHNVVTEFMLKFSFPAPDICRPADMPEAILTIGEATFQPGSFTARAQISDYSRQPEIAFQFDEAGRETIANLTARNIGKTLDMKINGETVSSPMVQEAIRGGSLMLMGNFTQEETEALTIRLSPPCETE